MASCEMCGQSIETDGERYHGMTVCEPCHVGKYAFRLDPLGIKIQAMAWLDRRAHHEVPITEVRALIPYPIGVEAMLVKEQLLEKIAKLFKKEVQVGNKRFDDLVYIRTDTPDQTHELLQDEDLRAAIITAVDDLESRSNPPGLEIDHNAVVVKTQLGTGHDINSVRRPATLVALALLRAAQSAGLQRDDSLVRVPALAGITGKCPKSLAFSQTELQDLEPLTALTDLEQLRAKQCRVTDPDLTPLRSLTSLTDVSFEVIKQFEDLRPLASMQQLTRLTVYGSRVHDLSPIAGLTGLIELNVTESQVTDLGPIAGLTNLQELYLRNTGVTDLSPLARMQQLRVINLRNAAVADLTPLHGLSCLTQVKLGGCRADEDQIRALQQAQPDAELDQRIIEPNPPDLT